MNKETFNNSKKHLKLEFENQVNDLCLRYAKELSIAKKGEFVQNSFGLIKIDSISYILTDDYLKPTYTGHSYIVKDGQPVKLNCESTSTLFDAHKVEFPKPEEINLGYVSDKKHYHDGNTTTLVFESGEIYTYCNNTILIDGHWFYGDILNARFKDNIIHDSGLIKRLEEYLNDKT